MADPIEEFLLAIGNLPRRNPHRRHYKPTVLVWAVRRAGAGEQRLVALGSVEDELNSLLNLLGPPTAEGVVYPWGKLADDDRVWVATTDGRPVDTRLKRPADERTLGGLTLRLYRELGAQAGAAEALESELFARFFTAEQSRAARGFLDQRYPRSGASTSGDSRGLHAADGIGSRDTRLAEGDRRLVDPELRRAVERHSVALVIEHLEGRGYECVDVGAISSYDIEARHGDDVLHVEVKGSISRCTTVELTGGEVEHARGPVKTLLAVVDKIEWGYDDDDEVVTAGGELRLWWNWAPEEHALVPIRFRYELPDD